MIRLRRTPARSSAIHLVLQHWSDTTGTDFKIVSPIRSTPMYIVLYIIALILVIVVNNE